MISFIKNINSRFPKLNLYMQTTEPEEKQGLWLQTDKKYNEIITVNNIEGNPYWDTTERVSSPVDVSGGGTVATVDNKIYLFRENKAYKYDIVNDTYTRLTDIPFSCDTGSCVVIGTDIYLIGSNNSYILYKYNTLTDTYIQLTNSPIKTTSSACVAIGTDIYIFGGFYNKTKAYKYDTLTDTYTPLTDIPYNFYDSSAVVADSYIYLIGGNSDKNIRYNVSTNTYTVLSNLPYTISYNTNILKEGNIYIFGGVNNDKKCYKYNIATDTYARLADIPQTHVGRNGGTIIGNYIYLFSSYSIVQVFVFPTNNYTDKSIIIETSSKRIETELIKTSAENGLPYGFSNFYYYTISEGFDREIPTYYGNGTQWIQIGGSI